MQKNETVSTRKWRQTEREVERKRKERNMEGRCLRGKVHKSRSPKSLEWKS